MCWPQHSSRGLFCGLRYNPIRIQRLFLHTFSDKPEKVCPRSAGYIVTAQEAVPVKPDRWADVGIGPYKVRYKPPPEAARYEITMLCSVIDS